MKTYIISICILGANLLGMSLCLAQDRVVSGSVINKTDNKIIPDAKIYLYINDVLVQEGVSDRNGQYSLRLPLEENDSYPDQGAYIRVYLGKTFVFEDEVLIPKQGNRFKSIEIDEQIQLFRGIATDQNGQPVKDLEISIQGDRSQLFMKTLTEDNGAFKFELPKNPQVITISWKKEGCSPKSGERWSLPAGNNPYLINTICEEVRDSLKENCAARIKLFLMDSLNSPVFEGKKLRKRERINVQIENSIGEHISIPGFYLRKSKSQKTVNYFSLEDSTSSLNEWTILKNLNPGSYQIEVSTQNICPNSTEQRLTSSSFKIVRSYAIPLVIGSMLAIGASAFLFSTDDEPEESDLPRPLPIN